jgi:hypothetical protein
MDKMGAPDRRTTTASGATVYVYGARNLHGDEMCSASYVIKDGKIVGYIERGIAINCDQIAGDTH